MNPTDNLDEIFDLVDRDDRVIGQARRKECNWNPGIIHRAVFILVFNDKDQILWQKRSAAKDVNPGHWDTSVSGHVDRGETYEQAAVRELREELGIELPVEYLGKFLYSYENETEFSAVFRTYSNGPFVFNKKEISEIKFLSFEEIVELERQSGLGITNAVHCIMKSIGSILRK